MDNNKNSKLKELLEQIAKLEEENAHLKSKKKYGLVWDLPQDDRLIELEDNIEDKEYIKILKFYLNQLNEKSFDYVFYIAGVDIHFNDRLGKLKISDEGINLRDELVTENFFSKGVPLCGVLGGGYNKDFNKLVELHASLHQSCAKLL